MNCFRHFPILIFDYYLDKELHKSCQKADGSDDQKKETRLLEVYAIEIQMYTEKKNNKKLKAENFKLIVTILPHNHILYICFKQYN